MKTLVLLILLISVNIFPQMPSWYPQEYWVISGAGMCMNIDTADVNRDGKKDIIIGNWNNTYVYFGGAGLLDTTKDIVYRGSIVYPIPWTDF